MKILYTPLERFKNLADYPFKENYCDLSDGLKMHYLDEGDPEGEVVLLLHGEPSWSFLYRFMIPEYVNAGYRVLCPDLIGFGKSGKPAEQSDYSYAKQLIWTGKWLNEMDVRGIHLFCQDWGGLIGLRLVAEDPNKFASVTTGNTGLPTGEHTPPDAFLQWQKYSQTVDVLPIGKILQSSTVRTLSESEVTAYEAPFPDHTYQGGAKSFPSLVPTKPDDPEAQNNKKAWRELMQWEKPFLCLFSDSDPITKGGERPFIKLVPGAKHDQHETIQKAGHFLQEDKGKEIAEKMITYIKKQT